MIKISFVLLLLFIFAGFTPATAQKIRVHQRIIVIMMDGFGEKYYRAAAMPFLNSMERQGIYKVVPSLMPAVTNVNNMAIATGTAPAINGITGNVYYDKKKQQEIYIEDPSILLAPSVFEKTHALGLHSALLSVKKKTIDVLGKYADYTLCPEGLLTHEVKWPDTTLHLSGVYSREINYEILEQANQLLKKDTSIQLLYIHTTDYPMHMWPPENDSVKVFLSMMDHAIEELHNTAPDAAILITADHSMNHKSQAWDLEKVFTEKKVPFKIVISPEKDRYVVHHRGLGGSAYVYLKKPGDSAEARKVILQLKGIDAVVSKSEAVKKYHLMGDLIGDLVVLGDVNTVFGHLDNGAFEQLPDNYRSHGSAYETGVPIFIYNAKNAPAAFFFDYNYKLIAWLFGGAGKWK